MSPADRYSRQFDTVFIPLQRVRGWKPFRVLCHQIDDEADPCLGHVVAGADAEPANLDQAGQGGGGADPHFSATCGEMNTVVADQNGRRDLSRAPGQNQTERQA